MDLYSFFNPKSIAIIGATDKPEKIGHILVKNLLDFGYEGQIFPINPKYQEILGLKCYSKISEIQQEVDLVLVAVPSQFVNQLVDEATGRSHNFVIISAGFSEIGKEGKKIEQKLLKLAEDRELNILGPNCLGFINPNLNLNASFAAGLPEDGSIAFLSQSGALAVALLDKAQEKKLGFSKIVSLGNKMQIDENEMLQFLLEDEKTKVVGLYLESLEKGNEFMQLASQIAEKKPLVILKAGKSAKAKEAMLSHTGSLSGEAKIISAAFQKAGAIEASNIQEFINLLNLLSRENLPSSQEAVIVTNAGGPGVLATDAFQDKKVSLTQIEDEIKEKLKTFLPTASSLSNPIDLLGDALEDRYQKTLEVLDAQENIGTILCLVTPQEQTPVEKIAQVLVEFSQKSQKLILPIFIGGEKVAGAKKILAEANLSVFDYPEEAIQALHEYFFWHYSNKNLVQETEINKGRKELAEKILAGAKNEKRKMLNAFEAEELLGLYNIPVSQIFRAEGSGFDFPVVLKVDDEKLVHKTDKGGVKLNIQNQEELEKVIQEMREKFPESSLIVQKQEAAGEEIILGIKEDPSFGGVVAYGLGGIFTEVFQKIDFVFPGMDQTAIQKAVENSAVGFMFQDFRGQKSLNKEKFSQILLNLLSLGQELPEIKEMDINPLFGFRDSGEFIAVDIKIMI